MYVRSLQVEVMGDLYRRDERHLSYRLPSFTDMLLTYPESMSRGSTVLSLYNDTLFYDLYLLGMDTVLKAFTVQLETKKCISKSGRLQVLKIILSLFHLFICMGLSLQCISSAQVCVTPHSENKGYV